MLLLIDIGNTRIKLALSDGEQIIEQRSLVHQQQWQQLADVLSEMLPEPVPHCLVASVMQAEDDQLIVDMLGKYSNTAPNFLKTQKFQCGLENAYTEFKSMGVDRWLAMIGARSLYSGAVLVVSCGTALTIDLVSAHGVHRGGYILPGLHLSAQALGQNTASVHVNETTASDWRWGKSTSECVNAGSILSASAVIDRAIVNAQAEFPEGVTVVMTGGDAPKLEKFLQQAVVLEPQLVFKGMMAVYSDLENAGKK